MRALAHLIALDVITPPSSQPAPSAKELALRQEIEDLRSLLQHQSLTKPTDYTHTILPIDVVCTGASLGLPGGDRVFSPDNAKRILNGENRLTQISKKQKNLFLMKDIVHDVLHQKQVLLLFGDLGQAIFSVQNTFGIVWRENTVTTWKP